MLRKEVIKINLKEFEYLIKEYKLRQARMIFYNFCVYMDPVFFTPEKKHLKQIADIFQRVEAGELKKVMVSMPPRAGKSYITSLFCAWMIGKHSDGAIMRNSYAADLAEKFSYDIREIIQKERYLELFSHVELKKDKRALQDWAITQARESSYFCAGVGGPISGKGCNLVAILDDPIKNVEEAMSETILDNVWRWYTGVHIARMTTGCPEIHIATRWSKKDPIGRLLELYPKDWTVLVIPALDEYGKSFCEAVKTTQEYLDIKKITEDFIWEAEFMQNPIESKGLLYPVLELNRFSLSELKGKAPDGIIGYTDTADQGTDYLCSLIGKRYGDYTYITNVVFTQEGVEVTEPLTAQMIIDSECKTMNVESNAGGKSFANNVQAIIKDKIKALKEIGTPEALQNASKMSGYHVYFEPTTQNKETRILMNAGYIKEYFYFRNDYEPGSDYDKYMRQLTSYVKLGKNKNDDAADATTGLAEYMQNCFYIRPQAKEELTGYYLESELEDMVRTKKITKYQMKQYLKKGIKSF